jgi:hypothetical protein
MPADPLDSRPPNRCSVLKRAAAVGVQVLQHGVKAGIDLQGQTGPIGRRARRRQDGAARLPSRAGSGLSCAWRACSRRWNWPSPSSALPPAASSAASCPTGTRRPSDPATSPDGEPGSRPWPNTCTARRRPGDLLRRRTGPVPVGRPASIFLGVLDGFLFFPAIFFGAER